LKLFLDNAWVDPRGEEMVEVRNPATGELIAKLRSASLDDVNRAVLSARKAWQQWRLTAPFERAAACHRIADRILARKEQIAAVISLEQGKPYAAEALPEVEESAENFRIAAEDVKRLETPIIPARDPNKKLFTFKEPIGTWAVITPWNFPTVIPSEYFGPGIAAGNTIVFKPAEPIFLRASSTSSPASDPQWAMHSSRTPASTALASPAKLRPATPSNVAPAPRSF
jgi:succinate-semialdehyde dehydrogenase/glutarate-semialdehyde dehydrogenase